MVAVLEEEGSSAGSDGVGQEVRMGRGWDCFLGVCWVPKLHFMTLLTPIQSLQLGAGVQWSWCRWWS